jgi:antitoxin component of MazEF toxin-antitoxin module
MLKEPKVRLFNELDHIILEVEDEGTQIKVDIHDKVLSLLTEISERKLKELCEQCTEENRHDELFL